MSKSPQTSIKFWNWLKSTIFVFNSQKSLASEDTFPSITQHYLLTQEKRDLLIQEIGSIKKENIVLEQSLREQQTQTAAKTEDLFLELLEVSDALENLLEYLKNNNEPNQEFIKRLPKSVEAVNRKFLSILKKRQVLPIELQDTQPDFNLCRVVDREVNNDLADQTITKIVRQGFRLQDKILRPTEVITSKLD
jgi:molecular chaperone GrpE